MVQEQTSSLTQERWVSPPSLNCPYVQVSNLGRVRTLDHDVQTEGSRHQVQHRKGRILKLGHDLRGRPFLPGTVFSKRFYGKDFMIHRLVAECFVPPKNHSPYVFQKVPPRSDVRADNLERGGKRDKRLRQRGRDVKYILSVRDAKNEDIGTFRGCGEVARRIGLTKQAVHFALLRGTPTRKGYFVSVAKDKE